MSDCPDSLDEWKGDLWNLAGIPSPPNDHETNETIVFGYMVAWFLGEVRCSPLAQFFRADSDHSSLPARPTTPSLPTSMNGKLVWPSLFAGSGTLTSPLSSPLTRLFWVVTSVLAVLTFTTTCSTLMLITKLARGVSTTDTVSKDLLHTVPMCSPPSVTLPRLRVNTC